MMSDAFEIGASDGMFDYFQACRRQSGWINFEGLMKGSCFCNKVRFEIDVVKVEAYHCHCSICRKVTGSKFNTAFTVSANNFSWTGGNDSVKTFQKNGKGFRHDFCGDCGCTVPNRYKDVMFWVPAGLLDDGDGVEVSKHIFVESKAKWDEITDDLEQFEGYP